MTAVLQTSLIQIRFLPGDSMTLASTQEISLLPEFVAASDPTYIQHINCGTNDAQHVLTVTSSAVFGGTIGYKCSHPKCIVNKPGFYPRPVS